MKTAKLLICYHKPDVLISDEILTPIHVGRALAKQRMSADDPELKWLLENMIGDDTGENISLRNGSYNELTSLYWAWKNYDELGDPDYIGLMHYRRHFVLREGEIKVYSMNEMGSPNYFDHLNYSPEKLLALLEECGLVCHMGEVDGIYKHYLANHRAEDMELALKILYEKYPRYSRTAKEYMARNTGNFCNMFIFPRELFFEYCEYIFPILEEFSRRADVSEKRFFISERLTGIFIFDKIKRGLKHKVLPINFVAEKTNVPVGYALREDNLYAVLLSAVSALENAGKDTSFTFYLMHGADIGESVFERFGSVFGKYQFCKFEFIKSELPSEYYPLEISERLPEVNKLVWFNEKTLAMRDLAEFFRTCSVDDYYISGIPETCAMNRSESRKLSGDIFMLNCARFRRHGIYGNALGMMRGMSCVEILNALCGNNIGYFAEWFITLAGSAELYDRAIISKTESRGQLQAEATWRPVLYYGENEPWTNIRGAYSNFWWNYTVKTPFMFPFPKTHGADELLKRQTDEIAYYDALTKYELRDKAKALLPDGKYNPLAIETAGDKTARKKYDEYADKLARLRDFRPAADFDVRRLRRRKNTGENDLSTIRKIKRFYRQYGLKKTLKRFVEKVTGK